MAAALNGHVRAVELLIAAKPKIDSQQKVIFTAYLLSNYLDVYRMEPQHYTLPVRMVTMELLECCWRPRLTSTSRLM